MKFRIQMLKKIPNAKKPNVKISQNFYLLFKLREWLTVQHNGT